MQQAVSTLQLLHRCQVTEPLYLLALPLQLPLASIPQFYFPGGAAPVSDDLKVQFLAKVNALFDPHPAGLNLEQFSTVVQEVGRSNEIL